MAKGEYTVLAELTVNGRVYRGTNSGKTHPMQKRFAARDDITKRHAEIDCIVKATRMHETIAGSRIHVWRLKKDTSLAMARPCVGCQRALYHFGVAWVTYTNEQGKVETLWRPNGRR